MADALLTLVQVGAGLTKMAKDFISASDAAQRNAQLIEFQQAIISFGSLIASVQQENAALLRQKNDVEEELKRMKDWNAEKQRYKLVTAYGRVMAYALQKAMSNGEPPHYICGNCFQNGKKSLLAPGAAKEGDMPISCAVCKFVAVSHFRSVGPAKYAEEFQPVG